MITHGMNVEEVRRLGRRLQEASSSLDALRADLDRRVARTTWVGPTAERFIHQWWPANRARLMQTSDQIHGLGQAALRSAAEQERASQRQGSSWARPGGPGGLLRPFFPNGTGELPRRLPYGLERFPEDIWEPSPPWEQIPGMVGVIASLVGAADDAKAVFYATMIGLTGIGMSRATTDAAFSYFRSAKGGFTTQLRRLGGKSGVAIAGAISAADYGVNVFRYGFGSSEAAASSFNGAISTAAAFVPGGGIAYEGGKMIGDFIYDYTPVGGVLEDSVIAGSERELGGLSTATDAALARGDFDEALRLSKQASAVQRDVNAQTSGYRGLWGSLQAVGRIVTI